MHSDQSSSFQPRHLQGTFASPWAARADEVHMQDSVWGRTTWDCSARLTFPISMRPATINRYRLTHALNSGSQRIHFCSFLAVLQQSSFIRSGNYHR